MSQESGTARPANTHEVSFHPHPWVAGFRACAYEGNIEYRAWLEYPEDFNVEVERWLVEIAERVAARGCNFLTACQLDLHPNVLHEGKNMTLAIIKGTMAKVRKN